MKTYKIGLPVFEKKYHYRGNIRKVYKNWNDLAKKAVFLSTTPYEWLSAQEYKYSDTELKEPWYNVSTVGGGSIYTCHSHLIIVTEIN